MKTMSIKVMGYRLYVIGILVLLGIGQANAVDYQTPYKGQSANLQNTAFQSAAMSSTAGFQSTSAYSGQWQGTGTTPMLNSDGSVNQDAYMGGPDNAPGMRKAPGSSGPGTPGGDLDPSTQQPIGDALLPLMLLACAYAIYMVSRKRKNT